MKRARKPAFCGWKTDLPALHGKYKQFFFRKKTYAPKRMK